MRRAGTTNLRGGETLFVGSFVQPTLGAPLRVQWVWAGAPTTDHLRMVFFGPDDPEQHIFTSPAIPLEGPYYDFVDVEYEQDATYYVSVYTDDWQLLGTYSQTYHAPS